MYRLTVIRGFRKGSGARIAGRAALEGFMATWKYHHKLRAEQLEYADRVTKIVAVGWYYGGDVYTLEGVPGLWLDECLLEP